MKRLVKQQDLGLIISLMVFALPIGLIAESDDQVVNVFNWADYIGTDTVEKFEK